MGRTCEHEMPHINLAGQHTCTFCTAPAFVHPDLYHPTKLPQARQSTATAARSREKAIQRAHLTCGLPPESKTEPHIWASALHAQQLCQLIPCTKSKACLFPGVSEHAARQTGRLTAGGRAVPHLGDGRVNQQVTPGSPLPRSAGCGLPQNRHAAADDGWTHHLHRRTIHTQIQVSYLSSAVHESSTSQHWSPAAREIPSALSNSWPLCCIS